MKLQYHIHIIPMIALMVIALQSCTVDLQDTVDVQVNFTAVLSATPQVRSFGDAGNVNTLVIGVFGEQKNEIYRKSFPISGISADVQLTLAQGQTYSFVFWAYDCNQDIYDINNLSAIKMKALPNPMTFSQAEAADAFFAIREDVAITENRSYNIELVRPLAQINIGTTGTTVQAGFTAETAPDTFHPFTKTVSGEAYFTWNFSETSTEIFSVEGNEYNYLVMGYVFAPETASEISAELVLSDGEVSKTVEFPHVKIEANQRTNIAGNITL